ncbi:MAG: AAA family ATPase [Planctomycetota bacterium]|jgi:pilus assembly protein CpaE
MKLSSGIVLATKQKDFAEKIRGILSSSREIPLSNICSGISELGVQLEATHASIAIVDIDSDTHRTLSELDQLVPLHPDTRFAVVSSKSSKELIIEAMQVGARYFMHKKFIDAELDRVLEKMIVDSAKTLSANGQIISVLSAGGGCGATTIAINLANELRLKSSRPILTIDLDEDYGAISTYLGIKSGYGIADVLSQKERIDYELIATSAASYKDDFDVLLSPASINKSESINGNSSNLVETLEACKTAYKYTIIDAPRVSEKVLQLLTSLSMVNLVVFQPNVKDVKTAELLIAKLRQYGVPSEKMFPLVNRYQLRGPVVPVGEIKKTLNCECIYKVRNDFKRVVKGINCGKPLSESAPRSPARRDMVTIAEKIFGRGENGRVKTLK